MPSCNTYCLTFLLPWAWGISLHGCSSKVQPLLLTLDEGYLLTAALSDLQCGIAPLGPPRAARAPWTWGWSSRPPSLASGVGLVFPAAAPGLGCGVVGCSSRPLPLASGVGAWGSSSRPLPLANHWPDSIQRKMQQKQIPRLSTLPPAGLGAE